MGWLGKLAIVRPPLRQTVTRLTEDWEPGWLRAERNYEASLYDYLHAKLESIQITRQYAIGRSRADIMVGERLIIEIKNDLNTLGKYHRLLGQIADFAVLGADLLVVLCGFTDPYLRKGLAQHLRRGALSPPGTVDVVTKAAPEAAIAAARAEAAILPLHSYDDRRTVAASQDR